MRVNTFEYRCRGRVRNLRRRKRHLHPRSRRVFAKAAVLPEGRVVGVETGGCPHTAVRDDIFMNLEAVEAFEKELPELDLIFVESGGDNLAAFFSPELVDASITASIPSPFNTEVRSVGGVAAKF